MTEMIALHNGKILGGVHEAGTCYLANCCIHNPSDHPLNAAPLSWMQEFRSMSRVCEHGFHHPDPDDMAFKMAIGDWITVEAISSVHLMKENCDDCCVSARSSAGTETEGP